jgi:hypothetical protein
LIEIPPLKYPVKLQLHVTWPPFPPPEQPSTNFPLVKLALSTMVPSADVKDMLPPAQTVGPVPGQFMFSVPDGEDTLELTLAPVPPDPEPPELVKLP